MRRHRLVTVSASFALLTTAVVLGGAPAGATPHRPADGRLIQVVITGTPGATAQVQRDVSAVGGRLGRALPVINGASALVPDSALGRLRHLPGVRTVAANAQVKFQGVDPALGYDVAGDAGSLYNVAQTLHVKDAWSHNFTGAGIDVALVDSGVVPVQGLTSGNVLNGPDLSFESQGSLAHLDTYGHGTHMASIIAGRDTQLTGAEYAKADTHKFNGIAPDARLISLKVAGADGATDVSQVIAAIDWVVAHRNDPGFNIRVLNLSFGTDSTQDPATDPLCYAVENAWRAGIVVVVAAGNDGSTRTALTDPAVDPLVVAVAAGDTRGSDSAGDDLLTSFTDKGTAARHADILVPGLHILGLRNPNSAIDLANSAARVGSRFFRGSGTSQAAAVASGMAAVLLQKFPTATPDQIKYLLEHNGTVPSSVKSTWSDLMESDVNKAVGQKLPAYSQPDTGATGAGSLDASRGSFHVTDGTTSLTGEQDIFGNTWNGAAWAAATSGGAAWNGGDWLGHAWTGNGWTSGTWAGHAWTDTSWDGHAWTDTAWDGHAWTGDGWDGHAWTDSGWSGHAWTDSVWAGDMWN